MPARDEFKTVQKLVMSDAPDPTAYVLLEDGTRFDGARLRAPTATPSARSSSRPAMTGYQEAVTDPSFAGQLITFTDRRTSATTA